MARSSEKQSMSSLKIDVPLDLKTILDRHPEIDWESVAEKAVWSMAHKVQLAERLAERSTLAESAAEAIGRDVKVALRRRYSKAGR